MTIAEFIARIKAGTPFSVSLPTDTIDLITITYVADEQLFDVYSADSQIYVLNPISGSTHMTEEQLTAYVARFPEWLT